MKCTITPVMESAELLIQCLYLSGRNDGMCRDSGKKDKTSESGNLSVHPYGMGVSGWIRHVPVK